jgi:photosystem II stability/assembly factor-like uncharacterized protein
MKLFTFLLLVILSPVIPFAQTGPVFKWKEKVISTGNNLQKMSINGSEAIIAGYGNTFYKTTDNGRSWKDAGILKPAMSYIDLSVKGNTGLLVSNREKLYDANPDVFKDGVMYITKDAGITWSLVDNTKIGSGEDPALNPNALSAFGLDFQAVGCANDSTAYCFLRWMEYAPAETSRYITRSGIFKTTDYCATWKNISGDLAGTIITSIAFSDTNGYIGGNKVLYKTSSQNDVLVDIFANLSTAGAGYVGDITVINKDEIYVTTTANGVFKSIDGGATFTKFNISGVTGGWDLYKVSSNTLVFVGGTNKSRVSNDGGATWTDCKLATTIWEAAGIINDSLWVLAKSDIYKIATTDLTSGNYKWKTYALSNGNNLQKAHIFNENKIMIIGAAGTAKITSDKGATWTDISLPYAAEFDKNLDFSGLSSDGNIGYASLNRFNLADYPSNSTKSDIYNSGGLLTTTDNWVTYTSLDMAKVGSDEGDDASKNPQLSGCNAFNPQVINYLGNNTLLLWARWFDMQSVPKVEHSRIFKTIDNGKTWKVVSDDFGAIYVQDIKAKGNNVYVGGNKIFQKSVDGGETFTNMYAKLDVNEDDAMFVNSITLGANDEVYVTTVADGVLKSTDGGNTFTAFTGPGGANDFYILDNNSFMALGTTSKSYFTNDGGTTWANSPAPSTIYEIGGVLNDSLYSLGQGKFYKIAVSDLDITTSVKNLTQSNDFKVYYGSSELRLVSSDKTMDRCFVYSVDGKLVAVTEPHAKSCSFNYSSFSPGIYIIAVDADGQRVTQKVLFK